MNLDLQKIKEELDIEDIINIISHFFPDIQYQETNFGLVLPTVCHNESPDYSSMKLYYYNNTHLFHCYTQCGDSFDIYELIKKISGNDNFYETLEIIKNCSKNNIYYQEADDVYISVLDRYKNQKTKVELIEYNPIVLESFNKKYKPNEWIKDKLTINSMNKYNIRYSISKNQIIIPHYDINNILIGIRVRNLNEQDLRYGKYMPAIIEGTTYSHPLSCNLYGINHNWREIERTKTAWIVEGEKSVILCDGWYGQHNIAVATCGNKISKFQLELLQKLGVMNIIICYDKMNENKEDKTNYFYKLYDICRSYKNYFNFSFIYDSEDLIGYKDAPVDYGREIFEYLLKKRTIVQ